MNKIIFILITWIVVTLGSQASLNAMGGCLRFISEEQEDSRFLAANFLEYYNPANDSVIRYITGKNPLKEQADLNVRMQEDSKILSFNLRFYTGIIGILSSLATSACYFDEHGVKSDFWHTANYLAGTVVMTQGMVCLLDSIYSISRFLRTDYSEHETIKIKPKLNLRNERKVWTEVLKLGLVVPFVFLYVMCSSLDGGPRCIGDPDYSLLWFMFADCLWAGCYLVIFNAFAEGIFDNRQESSTSNIVEI